MKRVEHQSALPSNQFRLFEPLRFLLFFISSLLLWKYGLLCWAEWVRLTPNRAAV